MKDTFLRILPDRDSLETLADGFATAEGPVWVEDEKALYFSELGLAPTNDGIVRMNDGRRHRWDAANRTLSTVCESTGLGNGMALDASGRLVVCALTGRHVVRLEKDGSTTVLADHCEGVELGAPNDVVVKSDGSIWFTDSRAVEPGAPSSSVFRIEPGTGAVTLMAREFVMANGLTFSPDERVLYVNDSKGCEARADTFRSRGTIRAYDVTSDNTLSGSRLFATLDSGGSGIPDGMKTDVEGNLYCTGPDGVWVFDKRGARLGVIETGVVHNLTDTTNLEWGEEDLRTLFITTSNSLMRIRLGIPGARRRAPAPPA
jgi:gluconolactonase